MDESVFNKIFNAVTGIWAIVAMLAVALFKSWPLVMARLNERRRDLAAEKAADWDRIRSERDVAREERDLVRDRWAECEAERIEWVARAMKAEAIIQGYGEARQMQAIDAAQKRLDGNGGGNA